VKWRAVSIAIALLGCLSPTSAADDTTASLSSALGPGWKQLPDWRGTWYLEAPYLFPGAIGAVIAKPTTPVSPAKFEHGITSGSYFTGAPYKPEFQKVYDERIAKARDSGVVDDPIDNCYSPYGMPRLMGAAAGAAEFYVTPKQTWIIWDHMNETRRIHTDGRAKPSEDMKWPRVMGVSDGHWEGQTLVVQTQWMKEGIYDRSGAPHSDQLVVTERITRTDASTITVEMTLDDPVMFTKPWQVTRHFRKAAEKWENVRGTYCAPPVEQPK
jgi:hypothetical protein